MDRGVKIALFVASIVSLGLGLVWDQVLSQARVMIEKPAEDSMGGERMEANVGSVDIPRIEIAERIKNASAGETKPAAQSQQNSAAQPENPQSDAKPQFTEYKVQPNEGWWHIAHRVFKDRGLTSEDVAAANPGVVAPKAGQVVKVPLGKKR